MNLADLTPEQLEELARAMFSSNKPLNFGPSILGVVIDALLCGILLMQCGSYISLCARDGWLLRITVAHVVVMNLWSTALAWASVWGIFVTNFGTYRTFFSIRYLSWTFAVAAGTILAVQMFFALRAWKMLNQNRVFGVASSTLMLATSGGGVALKIVFTKHPYTIYASKTKVPAYICLSAMVATDVLITTTILWYLLSWRGVNQRANHLLKKLMRVTFESQLPPTLIAIALLAVYTVKHDTPALIPLIWAQPKLYGISLLHTLNMRPELEQPTVVFGTTYAAPSCTVGNSSLRFAVGPARTVETGESEVVDISQSRSYVSTRHEPPKPIAISFNEESVATTPGDTLKLVVMPVASHSRSSDMGMEVDESKSKPLDLESHTATTG